MVDKKPLKKYDMTVSRDDCMMEEYQSIMKNDVWDVVPRLDGKFVVTSKWIYNIKHEADGSSRNPPQCIPIP